MGFNVPKLAPCWPVPQQEVIKLLFMDQVGRSHVRCPGGPEQTEVRLVACRGMKRMVAWGMWHGVAEGGVDIYIYIYIYGKIMKKIWRCLNK